MRTSGRDVPTAAQVPSAGPLGATNVQAALNLIAAAGPFFTVESFPSFAITSSFAPLKTLPVSVGTTRHLFALMFLASGTAPSPAAVTYAFIANATRTSGGVTAVSGLATLSAGSVAGFNARWVVSGIDAALEIRKNTAGNVNIDLLYVWIEKIPVP